MDRVIIPGEAPGSATYYMGFAPEEYGTRLYEMEHYGDAVIREALMDIGSQRTKPYQTISSSKEYEDLVWKSKGRTIYSCRFEVTYKDIYITVEPDFELLIRIFILRSSLILKQKDSHSRSTRQSIKRRNHSSLSSLRS